MVRQHLRNTRINKGVTQTHLAKQLGFKNPSGYANIEMGRVQPTLKNALIIARELNVNISDIFFEEDLHIMNKKQTS